MSMDCMSVSKFLRAVCQPIKIVYFASMFMWGFLSVSNVCGLFVNNVSKVCGLLV